MKKLNVEQILSEMTLEEKAALVSGKDFWNLKGIERLGVPSIMVTDGPHGLRKQDGKGDHLGLNDSVPATAFPTASGLASTWDRDLIQQVGVALGEETQAEDVGVILGPGVNIKRSPLGGRNFEYFSEDPYLASEMATAHVKGVQSQGVGTSLKHFAVNNQEHRRMSTDAIVDERTLREIYLSAFEGVVKNAQPWTVMTSYNRVNGTYASENEYLLTDILKGEWGHEGVVISDWGGVNEAAHAVKAGNEIEMPASHGIGQKKVLAALEDGSLPLEKLDQAVERILTLIAKVVEFKKENATYNKDEHHALARRVAADTMVLLKNEEAILPLKKEGKIAIIGGFAEKPRYQGGGSSHINSTRKDNAIEEMQKITGDAATFTYAKGYNIEEDHVNEELLLEARSAAEQSDVAIVFAGLPDRYESEGYDRSHMQLPENHNRLIEAVAEVQPNTIVILSNGSPIEMPWVDSVKGVVEGYLAGQAFGGAVADILFGEVNPSGKLAETFPKRVEENPSYIYFPGEGDRVEYREGLFVGYRYYDKTGIQTLFPFGHGLSYTTFEYSNLKVSAKNIKDTSTLTVSVDVKNTGNLAGKESVQLYVRDVESTVIRPVKELKGFGKVSLAPGETKTVTMTLGKRAFAYYNVDMKEWHVESGDFEVQIGRSSQVIELTETVHVESTASAPKPVFTRNTTIGDIMVHEDAAAIIKPMVDKLAEQFSQMGGDDEEGSTSDMMEASMKYLPLRNMVMFSGGAFSEEELQNLLAEMNSL
ncbi:beta-glucosidase [Paenibacillus macquariensis]|uniref:Beta-glucosidase n=1 Tax=Paenibacillus macquariensis TaxID=948756 RepID=A0ABY1KHF0_9BACL|nr:glycoside hydrolase family 3 C-terminal domain-containing protein [Paenibacillus macquariensis]OAB33097.1 glycosyl hydrolase [Paenibacillus macquariensis subsp. macquariensis]SIR68982.1 beta-glucosidase [Paenibacillus macquariensis]